VTLKEDLEGMIRTCYGLVRDYEIIVSDSNSPKEIQRARREIERQWQLIAGYLERYKRITSSAPAEIPEDIAQIMIALPKGDGPSAEPKTDTPPQTTQTHGSPAGKPPAQGASRKSIWQRLGRYEERYSRAVIVVLFAIVSVLVSAILFGLLTSSGVMRLAFPDSLREAEFGGAIAGFLITFLFLMRGYTNMPEKRLHLSGNVLNPSGEPVEGAKVFVLGVDRQKMTDSTGWFQIEVGDRPSWEVKAIFGKKRGEAVVDRSKIDDPIQVILR
jgi:hypothetical protein